MSSNHTPSAQPIETQHKKPHERQHEHKHDYYIGLMSGTSMDGVDGVIVDLSNDQCRVLAHHSLPFSEALKAEMLALNAAGANELHRSSLVANQLTLLYAQVVAGLLYSAELESSDITGIGAHGQTVRHCPSGLPSDGGGYTIQLNNPALLAERTGMAVVADFRSRDVAAGGQGAPLVPVFHQAVFGRAGEDIAVLNIGGIANLSLLHADGRVEGFDTGPGNALSDMWCALHKGLPYDANGDWAASGQVSEGLLDTLSLEAYFDKATPKSTGRDLFNWEWLQTHLQHFPKVTTQDVQATLVELTACSVAMHLQLHQPNCEIVYVCGGGALNHYLMARLYAMLNIHLPNASLSTTDALGIPVMQVEAAAFAWLAKQCVERIPLPLQKITGARGSRILGAVYPA
jgi:anhydro-N-acetylmuramic acid kinase